MTARALKNQTIRGLGWALYDVDLEDSQGDCKDLTSEKTVTAAMFLRLQMAKVVLSIEVKNNKLNNG